MIILFLQIYWAVSLLFFVFPKLIHRRKPSKLKKRILGAKTIVFSHRGGMFENFENSLSAFKHSKELGLKGIETDVRKTKDNKYVLSHDHSLKRITGQDVNLSDINYADIHPYADRFYMDYGLFSDRKNIKKEKPILLEELFKLIAGTDIVVNLDIKTDNEEDFHPVIEMAKQYGVLEQIIIGCFAEYSASKLRNKYGNELNTFFSGQSNFLAYILFFTGLLPFIDLKYDFFESTIYMKSMLNSEMYDDKLAYYYVRVLDLIRPMIKLFNWHLKRRDIPILYFCVNEEQDMDLIHDLGVNGVFTDVPTKMQRYTQKKNY